MTGKERCKILKEIRQQIADENDIPLITEECPYKGECKGTCPKCEAELAYLEKELAKRKRAGKIVKISIAVAATAAVASAAAAKFSIYDQVKEYIYKQTETTGFLPACVSEINPYITPCGSKEALQSDYSVFFGEQQSDDFAAEEPKINDFTL